MKIEPGSKYVQTRSMLREKIRESDVSPIERQVEAFPIGVVCYFCQKKITGTVYEVQYREDDKGNILICRDKDTPKIKHKIFLDEGCCCDSETKSFN